MNSNPLEFDKEATRAFVDDLNARRRSGIANRIIETLRERKGFSWWWDGIDADTQDEIREAIANAAEG